MAGTARGYSNRLRPNRAWQASIYNPSPVTAIDISGPAMSADDQNSKEHEVEFGVPPRDMETALQRNHELHDAAITTYVGTFVAESP